MVRLNADLTCAMLRVIGQGSSCLQRNVHYSTGLPNAETPMTVASIRQTHAVNPTIRQKIYQPISKPFHHEAMFWSVG
jgi:hypothetical protein